MKVQLIVLFTFCLSATLLGQTSDEFLKGHVSYISSQNVYVKFDNTDGIRIGDTLFVVRDNVLNPAIIVANLSSISCVGKPLVPNSLSISTEILARRRIENKPIEVLAQKSKEPVSVNDQAVKASAKGAITGDSKTRTDGRLSISSYTNITNYKPNQRFRYNLSLNAQHINNSKFSAESYISFTHRMSFPKDTNDWQGINNALKIYSLSVKYDIDSTSSISLGRKVNIYMANIGAVDGLQYEKVFRNFTVGALVGSRPDYFDYSFNPDLLQFGAFISHNIQKKNGNMQTSVAVFNQMNSFKTDRRFAYFQHSNSLVKNVDLFCSFEVDFYSVVNLKPTNSIDLTSTYVSLRYKPWKKLSLSMSYDARKNIYYYETFKNQIDSILDRETRQGLRFQFNYRPFKYINWGGTAGYRYQKSDSVPSMNATSYLTYSQVPLINVSATLTATVLRTKYMDGLVYGLSLSRDIIPGKLYTGLEYRRVSYAYTRTTIQKQQNITPTPLVQNIAELSLSWRLAKKLTLSVDFEATQENSNNFGRLYINLSQRF